MVHVGIIGTAGRDKAKRRLMTRAFYFAMYRDARERVRAIREESDVILVSGGAAWADHLAVSLFLKKQAEGLRLHLPTELGERGFVEQGFRSAGSISNYYHRLFAKAVKHSSIADLNDAVAAGAEVEVTPGFHARNRLVAAEAEILIAYTWGEGDEPADGGTKHTWDHAHLDPEHKIHVPLETFVG